MPYAVRALGEESGNLWHQATPSHSHVSFDGTPAEEPPNIRTSPFPLTRAGWDEFELSPVRYAATCMTPVGAPGAAFTENVSTTVDDVERVVGFPAAADTVKNVETSCSFESRNSSPLVSI